VSKRAIPASREHRCYQSGLAPVVHLRLQDCWLASCRQPRAFVRTWLICPKLPPQTLAELPRLSSEPKHRAAKVNELRRAGRFGDPRGCASGPVDCSERMEKKARTGTLRADTAAFPGDLSGGALQSSFYHLRQLFRQKRFP
jgi:hypothetical protein